MTSKGRSACLYAKMLERFSWEPTSSEGNVAFPRDFFTDRGMGMFPMLQHIQARMLLA